MKSDPAFLVFKKAVAAFIAFCLGFIITMGLCASVLSRRVEPGHGWWDALLHLGAELFLLFGVSGLGGIVAAIVSLRFHPTVMLRVARGVTGLFLLGMGILFVLASTSPLGRFVGGPLMAVAGVYEIWTAVLGTRSEVEGP